MSVWKTSCYRDDALQQVCNLIPESDYDCPFVHSLCDFEVEDPGTFELPAGLVAGNLKEQVEHNPAVLRGIIDRSGRKDPNNEVFARLVRTLGPTKFGIHGVYKFVSRFWSVFHEPGKLDANQGDFFDHLYNFGYAASYRTGQEAVEKSKSVKESLCKYVVGANKAIRDLIKIGSRASGPVHRRNVNFARFNDEAFPELEKDIPSWLRYYKVYWWKSILIITDPFDGTSYTFLRDDINRIERLVMGLAWSGFYLAEYTDTDRDLRHRLVTAFDSISEIVHSCLSKVSKSDANRVCRAFDVALWLYTARISDDVNHSAINEQLGKIRNEQLSRIVDQSALVGIASGFRLREALELLQIYKAFPQPDFDYFGAAKRQVDLYSVQKPFGDAVADNDTGTVDDLFLYFDFTLIRSYHQRHGVCPGSIRDGAAQKNWHRSYPHISPDKIPFSQVGDINMNNTFNYNAHGSDILDLIKDKAICPLSVANVSCASDLAKMEVQEKNQLMDILNRPNETYLPDLHRQMETAFYDVKAEDKPEAKKPFGRWFQEAFSNPRLVQSEYEVSVAEYAKTTTGCLAGKSHRDKVGAMNFVTELPHIGTEVFTRPFMISFDLEKFSPTFGMDYHERMDARFSEVFGQPHLRHASNIFKKGKVHYIKRKIHHSFDKMGRDFEGFAGRKNTIFHCTVMGYCVSRLRALGLIREGGRFVSLIDDGLLRINVDVDGYDAKVARILQVIEKVYKMANLYISWDKTFVSSHFAVFLNEFYYDGTPITPGIRSFLKMTNMSDAICPTIRDDLSMLESTARGAITSGAPGNVTYGGYAFHVMDSFRKWSNNSTTFRGTLPIAAFAPVNLGGFGILSVGGLSGSVAGPQLVEGIGNLRSIAVRFRKLVPAVNRIVNQPMANISPNERFRAPLAVKRLARTLKVTRGKQVIERRLANMIDTPVIRSLIGSVSARHVDAISDSLTHSGRVPGEMLLSVYESSVQAAISNISAKFIRARTAMRLVPTKAFFRAHIANMTEAKALVDEWSHV